MITFQEISDYMTCHNECSDVNISVDRTILYCYFCCDYILIFVAI